MSDGTGTDPSTDRCPDCGHLLDRECGCFCCEPTQHSTYIAHRSVRRADGGSGSMPFARCHCGWEGPGHLERSPAVQDAFQHLEAVHHGLQ